MRLGRSQVYDAQASGCAVVPKCIRSRCLGRSEPGWRVLARRRRRSRHDLEFAEHWGI